MQKSIFAASVFTVFFLSSPEVNQYYQSLPERNKQILCLAKNIYFEAATESFEGKSAVSQIVMNRVNDPRFPKDVCSVVYDNNGKVYQFSWVGQKSKRITNGFAWEESLYVAKKAVDGDTTHPALRDRNALYYHADYVNPRWKLRKVAVIGRHIFYAEKNT